MCINYWEYVYSNVYINTQGFVNGLPLGSYKCNVFTANNTFIPSHLIINANCFMFNVELSYYLKDIRFGYTLLCTVLTKKR